MFRSVWIALVLIIFAGADARAQTSLDMAHLAVDADPTNEASMRAYYDELLATNFYISIAKISSSSFDKNMTEVEVRSFKSKEGLIVFPFFDTEERAQLFSREWDWPISDIKAVKGTAAFTLTTEPHSIHLNIGYPSERVIVPGEVVWLATKNNNVQISGKLSSSLKSLQMAQSVSKNHGDVFKSLVDSFSSLDAIYVFSHPDARHLGDQTSYMLAFRVVAGQEAPDFKDLAEVMSLQEGNLGIVDTLFISDSDKALLPRDAKPYFEKIKK